MKKTFIISFFLTLLSFNAILAQLTAEQVYLKINDAIVTIYTFDVNENNQTVDIEMESADTDISLVLYDQLGKQTQVERSDRKEFILRQLNKGTYLIMAGTDKRGGLGNYNLKVNGLVSNLIQPCQWKLVCCKRNVDGVGYQCFVAVGRLPFYQTEAFFYQTANSTMTQEICFMAD